MLEGWEQVCCVVWCGVVWCGLVLLGSGSSREEAGRAWGDGDRKAGEGEGWKANSEGTTGRGGRDALWAESDVAGLVGHSEGCVD